MHTAQINPQTSTRAVKASHRIEDHRIAASRSKVLDTLGDIAKAKSHELKEALERHGVTVDKVLCMFEGGRDDVMSAPGYEYRLSNWQNPGDPLQPAEVDVLLDKLRRPLERLSSGFSRIDVRPRANDLVITFVTSDVPANYRLYRSDFR